MGKVDPLELALEYQDFGKRLSRLEDVKLALEKAVGYERHRINNLEANRFPRVEDEVKVLKECQSNLDRITGPKWANDLADMDKRLSMLERKVKWMGDQERGKRNV